MRPQIDLLPQHTHIVEEANLRPSGTLNTHTACCVLSLCLVLKSAGNTPPLKLRRRLSMPSSISGFRAAVVYVDPVTASL